MMILILGLVIFLGIHSIRIFADDWRTAQRTRFGVGAWKGGYSLISLIGFGLIIWGFGLARQEPVVLWMPPVAMRHIAALLMLVSFILIVSADIPRNGIKRSEEHTFELQSLMRISYAVFCLKNNKKPNALRPLIEQKISP